MSHRVVITPRALSDLTDIRDYIGRRSPDNAAKFLGRILEQFEVIAASPDSFSTAPEDEIVPYTLHQVVVKPYRLLYRVVGRQVQILHVRHGARLPAGPDELM